MSELSPIPEPTWQTVPPEALQAVQARLEPLERRIAELDQRLNTNTTNSSRPPSSDPPSVKRRTGPMPS